MLNDECITTTLMSLYNCLLNLGTGAGEPYARSRLNKFFVKHSTRLSVLFIGLLFYLSSVIYYLANFPL